MEDVFEFGVSPSPRSSGIINLGEISQIIYGAQQVTGKILSRWDLGPVGVVLLVLLSPWLCSALLVLSAVIGITEETADGLKYLLPAGLR